MSVATVYAMLRRLVRLDWLLKRKQPIQQLPPDKLLTTAEKEAIGAAQMSLGMQEIAAKFGKFPPKKAQSALNLIWAFRTGDFSQNNLVLFQGLKKGLRLLIHDQLNMEEREGFNAAMQILEQRRRNQ